MLIIEVIIVPITDHWWANGLWLSDKGQVWPLMESCMEGQIWPSYESQGSRFVYLLYIIILIYAALSKKESLNQWRDFIWMDSSRLRICIGRKDCNITRWWSACEVGSHHIFLCPECLWCPLSIGNVCNSFVMINIWACTKIIQGKLMIFYWECGNQTQYWNYVTFFLKIFCTYPSQGLML